VCALAVAQYLFFVVRARIAYAKAQHEAVELRFGQRICAVMFDWVLRRHDDERRWQRMCHAFDGDMSFRHSFKKRGLGFWSRAVDLVCKNYVCEYRSGLPIKDARVLVVNRHADNVRWQKV